MPSNCFNSSGVRLPVVAHAARAEAGWQDRSERRSGLQDPALEQSLDEIMRDPAAKNLASAIFAYSPFLTRCLL